MNDPARVRAFLAVPPDPGWVASARSLVSRLRAASPEASWTRPESWHLTLRFLGEVPRERIAAFAAAMGPAVAGSSAMELRSADAVLFPARGPARVLGVGFESDAGVDALVALAREAERCAREVGLEPEKRVWHPHVTLARIRRSWPLAAVARFRADVAATTFPAWPVRRGVLYESRLAPEGAVHTPIEEWPVHGEESRTA